jgi:hypothetical protein
VLAVAAVVSVQAERKVLAAQAVVVLVVMTQ